MDKIVSYKDVIDQLTDGMTIGVGGWGARRKPMSLIREICQSDLEDLTVVSYGGPDVGLLCAHKKIKKIISTGGYMSLPVILAAKFLRLKIFFENKEFNILGRLTR